MKKIFLLTLFFLQILRGVTTAQNPYKSIGKTTEVLTLSNGKYQEFFPNDTIVRIGSVLFNRVTNEVVEFLTEKDSSSLVEADVASRFLSVDPIGREYPELTPYQFASNTPIQAIDLDGLEGKHNDKDHALRGLAGRPINAPYINNAILKALKAGVPRSSSEDKIIE